MRRRIHAVFWLSLRTTLLLIGIGVLSEFAVAQRVLRVPDEYPTIQQAIDAAEHRDTVLVADGEYDGPGNVGLDFLGKAITVRSENGPDRTQLYGGGAPFGVRFRSGETQQSVLEGFELMWFLENIAIHNSSPAIVDCVMTWHDRAGILLNNSNALVVRSRIWRGFGGVDVIGGEPRFVGCEVLENWGSGIVIHSGRPTFIDCLVSENDGDVEYEGGGVRMVGGEAEFIRCTISGNFAGNHSDSAFGGGVFIRGGAAVFEQCIIADNVARERWQQLSGGGGVWIQEGRARFENCLISRNMADYGGAIAALRATVTMTNCTIVSNRLSSLCGMGVGGVFSLSSDLSLTNGIAWANMGEQLRDATVTWSCIEGGYPGPGNIAANPQFRDPSRGDFRLSAGSPCIDSGNNEAVSPDSIFDLDGNPRRVDDPGSPNMGRGTSPIVDMGAYEFQGRSTGLRLRIRASCPDGGPVRVGWANATPGGEVALLFAAQPGSVVIPPNRPCAGTRLDLGQRGLRVALRTAAGEDGTRIIDGATGPGACGGAAQLVDLTTCATSNVAPIE